MIGFLAHPFKDFKENVLYFIPVAIGMLLGIGLFSYPIEYLLENYQVFVLWSFAGAIIGTVPSLLKESTRESDRDKIDLAWFWTTFIISGLGLYALNFVVGTLSASFLNFVLAGALLALEMCIRDRYPTIGKEPTNSWKSFITFSTGGASFKISAVIPVKPLIKLFRGTLV